MKWIKPEIKPKEAGDYTCVLPGQESEFAKTLFFNGETWHEYESEGITYDDPTDDIIKWLDESESAPDKVKQEPDGEWTEISVQLRRLMFQDPETDDQRSYNMGVHETVNKLFTLFQPIQSQLQSLTSEVKRLREQIEQERMCFKGYETAVKAQKTYEPAIMSSAFLFGNGRRIIMYSSYGNGIKTFECDKDWNISSKPFAECPFDWSGCKTMSEYHLKIRAQHQPEHFIPEHSTPLDDQLFTQSKSTQ